MNPSRGLPFRITGLDHVVLRVRDMTCMRRFYEEVLGCVLERAQHELGLIQLRAGTALIDLVDSTGPLGRRGGPPPGRDGHNMDHLCLALDGFDEAVLRGSLEAAGATVLEAGMRYGAGGLGPSVYVQDPEGNTVELKGPAADAPPIPGRSS